MSPGFLSLLFHLGTILAIGLGIHLYRSLAGNDLLSRLIAAIVPLATLVLAAAFLMMSLRAPSSDWNAARLVPTFAVTRGYKLYYEPNAGPAMNFMYGPMAAYVYLPATLAKTPTAAILTAFVISLISFFGPVLWLLLQQNKQTVLTRLIPLGAFVCFGFLSFESSPLSYSSFLIHADPPALGLCAAACAVLGLRKRPDSTLIFIVSGLLASLAVWTKQTMVPILPGLIVYVWLSDGRRCALRFTLCILIVGSLVSLVFLALHDVRALIFNMFVKHLRHPLIDPITGKRVEKPLDYLVALTGSAQIFLHAVLVPLMAVIVYGAHQFHLTPGRGRSRVKRWVSQNPWLLAAIVGLAMITTSIACRIGVGGDWNDQSPAVYFLAIGAVLGLVKCITDTTSDARELQLGAKLLLLMILVSSIFMRFPRPSAFTILKTLPFNNAQMAYEMAKKNPGTIYFPNNPLSSLLAEGKLYHFLMGLHERAMDGYPVSREYFWEYLPANTQLIVATDPAHVKYLVEEFRPYLQQFSQAMGESSGWYFYRRER